MEPNAVLGMVFTLLIILMVGGFVLLFPLSRRLGAVLEQRLAAKNPRDSSAVTEIEDLRRAVEGMQAELRRINERQEFVDNLLAAPRSKDIEKLMP